MKNAIQCAREMLESGKYRETHGPNRSPAIDALCKKYGFDLGSAWCCLFVSEAFDRAEASGASTVAGGQKLIELPKVASTQSLLRWFRQQGDSWYSKDTQAILNWEGALAIRTDPSGVTGHVLFIEKRFTDPNRRVLSIGSVEGNTSQKGSRNGQGAYALRRIVPLGPYTWTYCNTSGIVGGQWWNR